MTRGSASRTCLPISPFQQLMVATALDPETHVGYHQLMTICWGCKIKPGVSLRAVRRVFETLVKRHDSLRLRFVPGATTWGAEILPEHPTGLVFEDISDLSEDAQTALVSERAMTPKHALSSTLFDMHLFSCGSFGSVILIKAHHSIMDGYGLIVLIEEMLKSFLNIPVLGKALSHREYVAFLQDETERNEIKVREFWNERLFPTPTDFNRPCLDAPVPLLSSRHMVQGVVLENIFTPAQSADLARLAKAKGVTDFILIYAAFAKSLCRKISRDEIFIYSSMSRHDAALNGFVGSCVQNIVTRFSADWGETEECARKVQQDMLSGLDHVPVDIFFSLNSPFNAAIDAKGAYSSRFRVHKHAPTGRLVNSPFRKIFDIGAKGQLSLGALSIEQLQWPGSGLTMHEVFLSVFSTDAGSNGTLVGRSDIFGHSDLGEIAADMVTNLEI